MDSNLIDSILKGFGKEKKKPYVEDKGFHSHEKDPTVDALNNIAHAISDLAYNIEKIRETISSIKAVDILKINIDGKENASS